MVIDDILSNLINLIHKIYNELKNKIFPYPYTDFNLHKIRKLKYEIINDTSFKIMENILIVNGCMTFIKINNNINVDAHELIHINRHLKLLLHEKNNKKFERIRTLWNGFTRGGNSSLFFQKRMGLRGIGKIIDYI